MLVRVKRVYEEPGSADGRRILVDRLWPRGMTKDRARVDLWLKQIAPSNELRKWFQHDPARWHEFERRYLSELQQNKEAMKVLLTEAKTGPITLLYAARDEAHNEAVVLRNLLQPAKS
jgi:uncharacterized protein YeaO (DUF488 family)